MRRHHRFGQNFPRRQRPAFETIFWLFGLAVLFYTGHIWPGILVLVGLSMIFSAFWPKDEKQALPDDMRPVETPPMTAAPVVTPAPIPPAPVVNSAPRIDLPGNCPRCGAPVRSNEVKWSGTHSAMCSYCGSTLPSGKK